VTVDEPMSPRFLKRSYGGEVLLAAFTPSMKIESDTERRASAMVVVPPFFKKFEDMFLGLLIRPVICLH
jgi:hypothetical protein